MRSVPVSCSLSFWTTVLELEKYKDKQYWISINATRIFAMFIGKNRLQSLTLSLLNCATSFLCLLTLTFFFSFIFLALWIYQEFTVSFPMEKTVEV